MSQISHLISRFKAEFAGRIVTTLSSALLIVILARLLDPDSYGLLFLAISVLGTVKVFSKLGIAKSAARYLAEYKETEPGQIPNILLSSLLINLVVATFVTTIFFVTSNYIANLIGERDLVPLLQLGSLLVFFSTLTTFSRLVFQGLEQIKISATLLALDSIFRLVFSISLVVLGFGVIGALAGYILSYMLIAVIGIALVYLLIYSEIPRDSVESALTRRIVEYSIPLTATGTANVLDKRVDTILVGFFLTPLAVSYYVVSKQAIQFVEMPASALGFTLSPTYGSEKASGNIEHASRIYENALTHSLLLYIPAAAGLILVAEPTIELLFGEDYLGATTVLQVFALYAVLDSTTRITSEGLDFLGRAKERAIIKGVTSVLNVVLNILLIPTIGVIGAAIATVISYSLYTFANLYMISLEFNIRVIFITFKIFKIIVTTLLMSFVVYFPAMHIEGVLSLFMVVLLGVIMWMVLSIVIGLVNLGEIKRVVSN